MFQSLTDDSLTKMSTKKILFRKEGGPLEGVDTETTDEVITAKYDDWANNYDQSMADFAYKAPENTVKAFMDIVAKNEQGIKISKDSYIGDIGAGTGIVGELLAKEGFTNLHAIDISPKMLEIAEEKGCYKTVKCGGLGNNSLSIKDEYDAVLCVGCITTGHIKPPGLDELVDMVKPGGLALFTMRSDVATKREIGYMDRLEKLAAEKKMRVVYEERISYLSVSDETDPGSYGILYGCEKLSG